MVSRDQVGSSVATASEEMVVAEPLTILEETPNVDLDTPLRLPCKRRRVTPSMQSFPQVVSFNLFTRLGVYSSLRKRFSFS